MTGNLSSDAAARPNFSNACQSLVYLQTVGLLLALTAQILPCNRKLIHYSWMMGNPECEGDACAVVTVIGLSATQVGVHLSVTMLALLLHSECRLNWQRESTTDHGPVQLLVLGYATQATFVCLVLFPAGLMQCTDTKTQQDPRAAMWHLNAVAAWISLYTVQTLWTCIVLEEFVARHSASVQQKSASALTVVSWLARFVGPCWTWAVLCSGALNEQRADITPYTGPLELIGLAMQWLMQTAVLNVLAQTGPRLLWSVT